jgi:hypothetical protein
MFGTTMEKNPSVPKYLLYMSEANLIEALEHLLYLPFSTRLGLENVGEYLVLMMGL